MQNEKFIEAVRYELQRSTVAVDGVEVHGQTLSHLSNMLRDKGWRHVVERNIEDAGFRIVKGKSGKWTKAGFRMVQPARVVVEK